MGDGRIQPNEYLPNNLMRLDKRKSRRECVDDKCILH